MFNFLFCGPFDHLCNVIRVQCLIFFASCNTKESENIRRTLTNQVEKKKEIPWQNNTTRGQTTVTNDPIEKTA